MSNKPGYLEFADLSDALYRLFSYRDNVQRKCANLGEMECRMLNLLSTFDEPTPMSVLAEALQVSHSRITRLMDSLVKKGLVSRSQSEEDRRSRRVVISAVGINATRHITDETREIQQRLIDLLPPDEVDTVYHQVKLYIDSFHKVLHEKEGEYGAEEQLSPWQPQADRKAGDDSNS
jgi:MarR family transcriptional regulator, transcriptional regulator for hemolysin